MDKISDKSNRTNLESNGYNTTIKLVLYYDKSTLKTISLLVPRGYSLIQSAIMISNMYIFASIHSHYAGSQTKAAKLRSLRQNEI